MVRSQWEMTDLGSPGIHLYKSRVSVLLPKNEIKSE